MKWLVDTNVLSELRKKARCDPGVSSWAEGVSEESMFTSVLVIGEIRRGLERVTRKGEPVDQEGRAGHRRRRAGDRAGVTRQETMTLPYTECGRIARLTRDLTTGLPSAPQAARRAKRAHSGDGSPSRRVEGVGA